MRSDNKKMPEFYDAIHELSADTLKGKQSVRTTFKLPSQVIVLLNIVARQLGLKQKSLFDQLVQDREILEKMAAGADQYRTTGTEAKLQKTYVVSRNSLVLLDAVAKTSGVPRDLLVEISINRLLPIISIEQKKNEQRRSILADMESFLRQGMEILHKADKILDQDDPAYLQVATLMAHCSRNVNELRELLERGKEIENYQ